MLYSSDNISSTVQSSRSLEAIMSLVRFGVVCRFNRACLLPGAGVVGHFQRELLLHGAGVGGHFKRECLLRGSRRSVASSDNRRGPQSTHTIPVTCKRLSFCFEITFFSFLYFGIILLISQFFYFEIICRGTMLTLTQFKS